VRVCMYVASDRNGGMTSVLRVIVVIGESGGSNLRPRGSVRCARRCGASEELETVERVAALWLLLWG